VRWLLGFPLLAIGCSASAGGWQMPEGSPVDVAEVAPLDPGDLPESAYPNEDPFWRWSEGAAWEEAETTRRDVLVDFYADWCDECRATARETWRDPLVRRAIASRYVPLRIDVTEITKESREQLDRYQVSRLPTSIAVTREGRELWRFSSPPPPDDLIATLRARAAGP
jgi:thiol:disulfide interchange protein